MRDNDDAFQTIEVPVNLNGTVKVRVPSHCHPEEVEKLALEQFKARLNQPVTFGESGYCSYEFRGEAWSTRCEAPIGCIRCSSGLGLRDWKSPNTQSTQDAQPDEHP